MLNLSLEIIAVITAILYLVLAAKEDVKCWYAAIISSSLYFYIMLNAGLLMEAILQVFYVGMAIYGWKQWNKLSNEQYEIRIKKWKKINHLYDAGNTIIIFTARFMGRTDNDYKKAYELGYKFTLIQLQSWNLKFNELILGKPSFDLLIDDKAFNYNESWIEKI